MRSAVDVARAARAERDAGRIPIVRLDHHHPKLFEELMSAVRGVAACGDFTLGAEVAAFEEEFAAYCETRFAVGVSSGTEALALALRALEIGSGDEVIVPANSFIATAEAVSLVGATPCLIDVDEKSHLITAEIVERSIRPRTRAVIPVHLMGSTVDLDPIVELARRAGIAVVEDACQAHGAHYHGRRVGTIGDLGCFSFYPTKNLGAWGDGGAVVTSDEALAERLRLLRSHGERPRYYHRLCGTTARLDTVQAAVLRRKLRRLDELNDARRLLGGMLRAALEPCAVEVAAPVFAGADHVYHQFVVRSDERDALRAWLERRGITTAVHYPVPIHGTEAYEYLGRGVGSLPVCERLARQICTLPLLPDMTELELERVAEAVREFAGTRL